MQSVNIEVDSKQLAELTNYFNSFINNGMPNTKAAFYTASLQTENAWKDYLNGDAIPGAKPLEGVIDKMVESVHHDKALEGTTSFSVLSNDKNLEKLSGGTPDVKYDMKKTHPYGLKSRVSKDGVPYLIIPFRWGTPNGKGTKRRWNNVIPMKQYNTFIRGMEMSEHAKDLRGNWTHNEPNYKGDSIERHNYKWRSRLTELEAWDDRSVGMVRMKNGLKSTYFTFRIISAKSPANSWIYFRKGQAGNNYLEALARFMQPKIENMVEAGIKADISEL